MQFYEIRTILALQKVVHVRISASQFEKLANKQFATIYGKNNVISRFDESWYLQLQAPERGINKFYKTFRGVMKRLAKDETELRIYVSGR